MDPYYTAFGISTVVIYVFLAVLFGIIYKITTKEFHKFTKNKLIADVILYSISIIALIISISFGSVDISSFTQTGARTALFAAFTILALAVDFYSVHLFVCSIVNIYKYFWKKKFKKNKKDLVIGILYLIFLNGFSKKILLGVIGLIVLMILAKACPQEPCGIEVVQVFPGSPAEMSGITKGEVITATAYGQQIKTNDDFRELIASKKPGDTLRFETEAGKKYDINLGEKDGKAYFGTATKQKLCSEKSCILTAEVVDYTSEEPVVVETRVYEFE